MGRAMNKHEPAYHECGQFKLLKFCFFEYFLRQNGVFLVLYRGLGLFQNAHLAAYMLHTHKNRPRLDRGLP